MMQILRHTNISGSSGWVLSGCGVVIALLAAPGCHMAGSEAIAAADHGAHVNLAVHGEELPLEKPDPPLTSQQRTDIDWLRSILLNPNSEQNIRAGAAVRLLNMSLPQATAVLAEGLRSNDQGVMTAVVEAMQQESRPVPGLLQAAAGALSSARPPLLDQLSVALARYGDVALEPIAVLANDTAVPVARRLGPIHALGAFRSKSAAVELMSLLNEDRVESEEVIGAVAASLQRATGLPYGHDVDAWREWWELAKDQPREEWMSQIIRRLSEQLAEAEFQIQRERDVAHQTELRLAELYRSHFAALASVDEQLAMLPPLLDDPLASVRGFALDRVARLLRDSVRIGEELQGRIAQRLDDPLPSLRLAALRLLDQMNYDQTGHKVAARLQKETSPEVMAALLDVLMRRPLQAGIDAVQPLVGDALFGERAADVIWRATGEGYSISEQQKADLLKQLREAAAGGVKPAHARLLALLGNEQDVAQLEALLDGEDETLRRRVGDGFVRRGHHQPLLDRAADATLYPYAARAIATGPTDLAAFRTLVLMRPPDQHRALWNELLEQMIVQLTPEQLLQADDVIAATQENHVNLRLAILRRGARLPADAATSLERDRMALRLGRLLLDLNQPAAAHELFMTINGELSIVGGTMVRFEAAVLVGEYDLAARLVPEVDAWMDLLTRMEMTDASVAIAIHNEIVRRFSDVIAEEHASELEAVYQRLQSSNGMTTSPA